LLSEETKNIYPVLFDPSVIDTYKESRVTFKYDIPYWQKSLNSKLVDCLDNLSYLIYYDDMQAKNIKQLSMLEVNDKNVKIRFILNGEPPDYWAKTKPVRMNLLQPDTVREDG
jgi:hypothetical protein